jgi:hypothetical protein
MVEAASIGPADDRCTILTTATLASGTLLVEKAQVHPRRGDPMSHPPGHDPSDLPEPASLIPSLPGGGGTPLPAPVRDPGDVDSALPATPGPAPERIAPPPGPEDPVALAKRLAEEAKRRAAAAPPPAEDPIALAKRLVEEAKKKAASAPPPAEDPVALAKRLAEEAKKKAAAAAPAKPTVAPPKPAAPVAAPGPARPARPKTAAEILAEAREAESRESTAREDAARKASKAAEVAPKAAAPAPRVDPHAVLASLLRGATIERAFAVQQAVVFKAVWQAHLARAQATEDIALATTASALIGAIDRIGASQLITAEVRWGGQHHVVWLDQTQGTLVATAFPAHVYLAGSS